MSTRSLSNYITLALALIGCALAIILTVEHYHPDMNLPCGAIPGSCKGVLESDYGKLGPIPTSLFGAGMYAVLAGLCVLRGKQLRALRQAELASAAAYASSGAETSAGEGTTPAAPAPPASVALAARTSVQRLDMVVWGLAVSGVVVSWWLQYTALFVLLSFCPWCFGSAITITLIAILASIDFLVYGRQLNGEQKLLAGVCAFILAMMVLVMVPRALEQYTMIWMHNNDERRKPTDISNQIPRDRIVVPGMHVKGDPNAPNYIVKFSDFQCPACRKSVGIVDKLLADHPNQFQLAYRHYHIANHQWSYDAAIASEAAAEQGKFWEMHDVLFKHQEDMGKPSFNQPKFEQYALEAGLNLDKFHQSVNDLKLKKRVDQDIADGEAGGLSVTPTFFVVTPKKVWRFSSIDDLQNAVNDKTHDIWK